MLYQPSLYDFNEGSSTSPFKTPVSRGFLNATQDSGFASPNTSKVVRKITSFPGFGNVLDKIAAVLD